LAHCLVNIPAVVRSKQENNNKRGATMLPKKKNSKMKNSITTLAIHDSALNGRDTNKMVLLDAPHGNSLGIWRSLLLATALLGLTPTLQASNLGFNLLGQPSAAKTEEPGEIEELQEVVQLTGAGAFNPEAGTAAGGGSFAAFNALDDIDASLGGPTFRGTWKVTDLISWTPDGGPNPGLQGGTLQVRITLSFKVGLTSEAKGFEFPGILLTIICPFVDGAFVESEDAINLDFGFETFTADTTGFTGFHLKKP
jgi:hypothetical protein